MNQQRKDLSSGKYLKKMQDNKDSRIRPAVEALYKKYIEIKATAEAEL